eukprot:snap_masked-scaffold_2-processed-gene-4.24-mRNA-1 protein AED:1.00 eAED:1.00 QI:0/-1/0/0/-1/1/1/0/170
MNLRHENHPAENATLRVKTIPINLTLCRGLARFAFFLSFGAFFPSVFLLDYGAPFVQVVLIANCYFAQSITTKIFQKEKFNNPKGLLRVFQHWVLAATIGSVAVLLSVVGMVFSIARKEIRSNTTAFYLFVGPVEIITDVLIVSFSIYLAVSTRLIRKIVDPDSKIKSLC